ncbi:tetratricopeptide repeat protein [Treponema sp. HNW]|uniref:tetratricopeptide repeat protein n=1 Tax=Treponema sp. HNW TaxID=3116654 RepID=UPI003D0AE333
MNKKNAFLCLVFFVITAFCFAQESPALSEVLQSAPASAENPAENPGEERIAPAEVQRPSRPAPAQNTQRQKPDALKLYTAGRYAEAVAVCEQEIKEKPNNIESYVVLCWSLVRNRQYSEAEYWALQGRKISQYDQRLVEILGEAKFYLGQNREALALFQEYISLVGEKGSRLGESYYFMGEIYIRLARYNHADIAFSQAVRTEPLYDYWWTRLGYAREMAGNFALSAAAYEKALELNAGQADALRGRDRVRARL